MNQNKTGIRHLAELCAAKGIEQIVISPGSRNAPIILAFDQQKSIECLSITDERSAAFFALGIAQHSRKPVAIACTSGSAALNYAPAIAEAYYQKMPLLVLTADRPNEWIDMADSQTIRQKDIFKNYIRKSIELPQSINSEDDLWYTDRLINEAINACTYPCPGPVHINLPFTEPLYEGYDEDLPKAKIIETIKPSKGLNQNQWSELKKVWDASEKKMLLTGMLQKNDDLNQYLKKLAKKQCVVLTETTSNLYSEDFHSCIDRILATISEQEAEDFTPDLLITFGNQIISKKIKAFLRKHKPNTHWHIDPTDLELDTYQSLTNNIPLEPTEFLKEVAEFYTGDNNGFASKWAKKEKQAANKHQTYLSNCEYSDLKVFDLLLKCIPKNSHLQLANSTPVRYAQLYNNREDLTYFSNRGTSGIDGSISTAVGASFQSKTPTTLITGDLSFFYDSNGLWNNYIPDHLKIIIINNGGGGIFRFIDGPAESNVLDYFETPHQLKADKIVATFGLDYFEASNLKTLKKTIEEFYKNKKAAVLEIFTPQEKNALILKDYFRFLKKI